MATAQGLYAEGLNVSAATTTWVDVCTIAAGSFTAGKKYLILAVAHIRADTSSNNDTRVRLVHGGTPTLFTDANSAYEETAANQDTVVGWMEVWTQPGTAELVKLQVSSSSTSTHRVLLGQIFALKLSDDFTENTDYFYNEVTADYTTTATPAAQASVTFTPNGTDQYLVIAQSAVDAVGITTEYMQSIYESVANLNIPTIEVENEDATNEYRQYLLARLFTPSAVSHTFSTKIWGESAGDHIALSSRIFVLRLDKFAAFGYYYLEGEDQPSATWETEAGVTVTPTVTGDWFYLGWFGNDVGSLTDNLETRLQVNPDGSGLVSDPGYGDTSPGQDAWDATDVTPFAIFNFRSLTSGASRAINLDCQLTSGTTLRVQTRTLAAFSMELATTGINITLAKAALTATGQAFTIAKGAVSIALSKAVLTATGMQAFPARIVALTKAALTATGQAFTIAKGSVLIALTKAVLTATGQTATVTKGPVAITLAKAILTATGQTITISAPSAGLNVNLAKAVLTAAGQTITIVPGAISKALATAQLVANGRTITIAKGPVSIQLDEGQLIAHGENITILKGAVTITLTKATVTALGRTITISAPGAGLNVNLTNAILTANGRQITIVPGAVTKALSKAVLTAAGQQLTVLKGAVSIAMAKASMTATGRTITIVPGAVSRALSKAVLIATGRPITVYSPTGDIVYLARAVLQAIGRAVRVIQDLKPTPAERVYIVPLEDRTFEVGEEDRIFEVIEQIRTIIEPGQIRTYIVPEENRTVEVNEMEDEREFEKGPGETLDYVEDWATWLNGDTIATSSWTVPTGIIKQSDNKTNTLATIWLIGGTLPEIYPCVNTIVTTGGRTAVRTINIIMVPR